MEWIQDAWDVVLHSNPCQTLTSYLFSSLLLFLCHLDETLSRLIYRCERKCFGLSWKVGEISISEWLQHSFSSTSAVCRALGCQYQLVITLAYCGTDLKLGRWRTWDSVWLSRFKLIGQTEDCSAVVEHILPAHSSVLNLWWNSSSVLIFLCSRGGELAT